MPMQLLKSEAKREYGLDFVARQGACEPFVSNDRKFAIVRFKCGFDEVEPGRGAPRYECARTFVEKIPRAVRHLFEQRTETLC